METVRSTVEYREKLQRAACMQFSDCVHHVGQLIGRRQEIAILFLKAIPQTSEHQQLQKMIVWYDEELKKLLAL